MNLIDHKNCTIAIIGLGYVVYLYLWNFQKQIFVEKLKKN